MQIHSETTYAVVRKVAWRLIPFLGLLYLMAFVDRINVGFAALTMNADLGFSATVFGTGAGIFFLGYVLCGVPSNLMLHRLGARRWISMTMVAWGIVSAAMALIRSPSGFYALRLLLGMAEAGFFPGVILYLTYWFSETDRARILGAFMVALPLSSAIGAPISAALLEVNTLGLHGWQWLFLAEGVPAALVGALVLRFLPDRPEQAHWLTPAQRAVLIQSLRGDRSGTQPSVRAALNQRSMWVLCAAYFALLLALYGYSMWLPQIIDGLGSFSHRQIALLAMLPNVLAALVMYPWSRHSDTTRERRWHIAIPLLLASVGFTIAAFAQAPAVSLAALGVAAVGIYCSLPVFWSLPAKRLTGASAATGIAIVNSVGNLAGYVGPAAMGYLKQAADGYAGGLVLLAVGTTAAALLVLSTR